VRIILALLILAVPQAPAGRQAPAAYDRYFTSDTMRVDYFHTGGPKSGEVLSLDRVLNDGAWPGSRTQLLDETNLGTYLFELRDKATGALMYSRGLSPLYSEWETTSEAKTAHRTFH